MIKKWQEIMFLEQKMLVFWSKNIAEMGGTYAVPMRPKTSYNFFGLTILTNIVDAEDFAAHVALRLCRHLVAYFVTFAIACTVLVC